MEYRTRSGWYYVGHGRLRLMDEDGWTDQYRNIDNPPRAVPPGGPLPSSALPADQEPVDRPSRPVVAWFLAGAVTVVLAVMAGAPHALVALFELSAEVLAPAPTAQGVAAEGVTAGAPSPSDATSPTSTSPPSSVSPTSSAPLVSPTSPPSSVSPTLSAPVVSPPPAAGTFDRQRALAKAADIVGDIQIVDQCLADGVDVNSALTLLSRSYGRLAEAGVPPGVDRSRYAVRVTTLQALTLQAAEGYDDNHAQAVSVYSTARRETRVLFKQLNVALGSNLSLP